MDYYKNPQGFSLRIFQHVTASYLGIIIKTLSQIQCLLRKLLTAE